MKKIILVLAVLLLIQQRDAIRAYFNATPATAGTTGNEVVLYATSWCGYCAKMRKFLAENQIPYSEYDIERSGEAKAQYDALRGTGVPLMVVNGDVIRGYNPNKVLNALR